MPLEGRVVTLTRQDDQCMEAEFHTLTEALSFVSLVDGYFRLTTDSTHYFCTEVAPPSLLQDIQNYCHGPITSEFAVHKLKKAGAKNGMFLLRHSPKDFDKYFLTVCIQTHLGLDYKDCLIEKNEKFSLAGIHNSFCSLKQLTDFYQHSTLLMSDIPVTLGKCCPPRPKGRTFLCNICFLYLNKQQFYEHFSNLPALEWTELAELIAQCMQYQPELRPSCRSIIRQLNSLITSGNTQVFAICLDQVHS
ncbi:tyrosine-protein kinase JAK2-like [Sinocyclocheilus anshuiensis]|uniref:tyrosine-protein kinase JAK2-like n=1 Tax=Sinocyclocheilus anshuiensis TaxID=1608454 RepID=UPI0007BA6BA3|nr:PREDICTED: tyrosine-protein kinase JAK2-like [Sinocyclocheilus anshuiensis]